MPSLEYSSQMAGEHTHARAYPEPHCGHSQNLAVSPKSGLLGKKKKKSHACFSLGRGRRWWPEMVSSLSKSETVESCWFSDCFKYALEYLKQKWNSGLKNLPKPHGTNVLGVSSETERNKKELLPRKDLQVQGTLGAFPEGCKRCSQGAQVGV